jgi:molecular chaperone GrpE (heat shock protein)
MYTGVGVTLLTCLVAALKKEQEEKAEAEAKLAEYNARLKDVEETRAAVDAELEGLRSRTEKLRLGAYTPAL